MGWARSGGRAGSLALLVLVCPWAAWAQGPSLEIAAIVGFRAGGTVPLEERAFQHRDFGLAIGTGGSYGAIVDLTVTRNLQLELLLSRQAGSFEDHDGLFGERPGGFVDPGTTHLLDVDVLHYQGGVLFQWGAGWVRPYVAAGAGITRIEPSLPLPADSRFSFSVGTGVRVGLNRHLGLRFEGRLYWADTDESIVEVEAFQHRDCTDPCTYTYRYDSALRQGEVSLGVVLRV